MSTSKLEAIEEELLEKVNKEICFGNVSGVLKQQIARFYAELALKEEEKLSVAVGALDQLHRDHSQLGPPCVACVALLKIDEIEKK